MTARDPVSRHSARRGSDYEDLDTYLDSLEGAPEGEDMQVRDWLVLALTGIIIPVGILIWGWL